MPDRKPRRWVEDNELHGKLRDGDDSETKSARVADSPGSQVGDKGGESPPYGDWTVQSPFHEEWTVADLQERAAQLGIEGRSSMDKDELVEALRDH